ncbi:MAG TPA: carboxypeptidase regulatory-like domain-containing protein, partial [Candidatus Angelobacter sp.]|nr:carboxypeptidase regulatory-like domain-containing protein [Candidatus Angelobacter sp.]
MSTGIKRITLLFFTVCYFAMASFATDIVSGKVRNQTTQRPSSGDDVVLLRMEEGMQEESRTHTDANGAFSLQVEQPNAQYVVRVLHQNVNYDHTLTGTSPFQVDVFD